MYNIWLHMFHIQDMKPSFFPYEMNSEYSHSFNCTLILNRWHTNARENTKFNKIPNLLFFFPSTKWCASLSLMQMEGRGLASTEDMHLKGPWILPIKTFSLTFEAPQINTYMYVNSPLYFIQNLLIWNKLGCLDRLNTVGKTWPSSKRELKNTKINTNKYLNNNISCTDGCAQIK